MLALLATAAALAPHDGSEINCTELVRPIDCSPIRSPQEVHTALARRFVGKKVLEIGTRNGDGITCFARVTRAAVATEMQPEYCRILAQRAADTNSSFKVVCDRYQNSLGASDPDVVTWWQQGPGLVNSEVLAHLRQARAKGELRADVQAVVLHDMSWPDDRRQAEAFRSGRHAESAGLLWSVTVCRRAL